MLVRLLNAVTSTGAGSSVQLPSIPTRHTIQVTMGGTVVATAVTVDLEGSLDNVFFTALASHVLDAAEITAEGAIFHIADKPIKFVRANLITLTGGTAPTITVDYQAKVEAVQ